MMDCAANAIFAANWRDRARVNITVSVPRGSHARVTSGNGEVSFTAAAATARSRVVTAGCGCPGCSATCKSSGNGA